MIGSCTETSRFLPSFAGCNLRLAASPYVRAFQWLKMQVALSSGHRVAGRQRLRVPGSDSHLGAFLDADDFHSAANKDKMHRGVALTDDDRRDWLKTSTRRCDRN